MKPAWMCLPPAVLSAFLGAIALPASARAYDSIAEPPRSHAYAYIPHVWGECVTLRLTDGRVLAGLWRGPLGSPFQPSDYASRYETWRGPWGSFTAPALGESLFVTLRAGESLTGEFKGFAGGALLLATPDSCAHRMVMLDSVVDVRRSSDPATEAEWSPARGHWPEAPSLDGIALQSGQTTLAVPTAAIAGEDSRSPAAHNGSMAGGVILGVLVAGFVAYIVSGLMVASALNGLFRGLDFFSNLDRPR